MKTEQAYLLYQSQAQQNANFENTLLWIFFVLFVIAPIMLILIYIPVAIYRQPKCPNCGGRRMKAAFRVEKRGDVTTSTRISVCRNCGHETI